MLAQSWTLGWRALGRSFWVTLLITIVGLSGIGVFPAEALTQLNLSNLTAQECPAEVGQGAVTSGGISHPARCFLITGTANNLSNKTVYDADVYGRIYDANGDTVMQNRTRVGAIEEIPPGKHDFEIRISVPANQPVPLQLKQFKASGFSSSVKARF